MAGRRSLSSKRASGRVAVRPRARDVALRMLPRRWVWGMVSGGQAARDAEHPSWGIEYTTRRARPCAATRVEMLWPGKASSSLVFFPALWLSFLFIITRLFLLPLMPQCHRPRGFVSQVAQMSVRIYLLLSGGHPRPVAA